MGIKRLRLSRTQPALQASWDSTDSSQPSQLSCTPQHWAVMYSVHHCHQTPSAPHWSAASTLHSSSRSEWSHPQYKPHAISDLITTVESCRLFNIPKRLAQMADVMTADIYWNSINAPLVTFCCRIIAPLNFCLSRCLEVMESCLFFICWSGADALLHFHQGRAAASSSCSLEKQIWFEVSFLCMWFYI